MKIFEKKMNFYISGLQKKLFVSRIFVHSLRKLTGMLLQEAKYQLIAHRTKLDGTRKAIYKKFIFKTLLNI